MCVVATSETLQRRPRWFQTLAAQPTVGWDTARSILAAVDMSVARFQTRGFTGFEGIITHPANLKHLQDRFSPQQEFSATQLEGYATCPFRFWVSDVLKLREVDSPINSLILAGVVTSSMRSCGRTPFRIGTDP